MSKAVNQREKNWIKKGFAMACVAVFLFFPACSSRSNQKADANTKEEPAASSVIESSSEEKGTITLDDLLGGESPAYRYAVYTRDRTKYESKELRSILEPLQGTYKPYNREKGTPCGAHGSFTTIRIKSSFN